MNTFSDKNGEEVLYVVNFENGGFMLIPTDKRIYPILAYSDKNLFPTEESDLPENISYWVQETKKGIQKVKEDTKKQSKEIKIAWEKYLSSSILKNEPPIGEPGDLCDDVIYTKGPLIQTEWGQRGGYNALVPTNESIGCSNLPPFEHVPAGCATIATAQVMKYYEHPSNAFDWSTMENNLATLATATLIERVGYYNSTNYGCDESSVPNTNSTEYVLKTFYGYSSTVQKVDYNYATVKNELAYNRPVLFFGDDVNGAGHVWVCEGYKTFYFCESGVTYLHFYMNWGWYGPGNGWYGSSYCNPDGTPFILNGDVKIVIGIKP